MSYVIDARGVPAADVAEEVARAVFAGGTVIFPNDTSYGIGCDPYRSEAIDRIYAAKGRPDNRPLTMHVATPQEFLEYAGDNPLAVLAAKRLLPGPGHSARCASRAFVSDELAAGLQTLAFRVPDDPFARALLDRCGPLAGTTVNPRGGAAISRRRRPLDAAARRPARRARTDSLRPRILDRRSHRARTRGCCARARSPATRLAELLGSGRTSYDKGAHATSHDLARFWPLIARRGAWHRRRHAARHAGPPRASARPPRPPRRASRGGAVPPPASAAGAAFDLGVWTVHASSVDANFKTGDFSTPAKIVMTRNGGDVSADRANGNYKTQIVNLDGHVVMHDTQGGLRRDRRSTRRIERAFDAHRRQSRRSTAPRKIYKAIGNVHYVQADTVVDSETGRSTTRRTICF